MKERYTGEFFKSLKGGSKRSANRIVPLVLKLVPAKSVVDVGCGVGTWLAAFAERGVTDVFGIDGDYVERSQLEIAQDRFGPHDLTQPIRLDRRFDLVLCLEVAEHLAESSAATLIDSLVRLGPVVLFSAAIPGQGGTGHLNERWPDYWADRFSARGYVPVDCIRQTIWQCDDVEWWYAQNILLFAEPEYLQANDLLRKEAANTPTPPLSLVHPKHYLYGVHAQRLAAEAASIMPEKESLILVDDCYFGTDVIPGRRCLPFLERNSDYWGAPADDGIAIKELERMRHSGSAFVIFAWPSFWWLEHYSGLHRYLRSKFECVRENDCIIAFDLRTERAGGPP